MLKLFTAWLIFCSVTGCKELSLSPEASHDSAAAVAEPSGKTFKINLSSLAHIQLLKVSADKRLVGFDSDGKATDLNLISPSWILPLDYIHLKQQKFIILTLSHVPHGATPEQYKVKTDTGFEVFSECNGLVVFDIENDKSDCFDKEYGAKKDQLKYSNFTDNPVHQRKIFALKTIREETKTTFEVIERSVEGLLTTAISSERKSNEKVIAITPTSMLLEASKVTQADPYAASSFYAEFKAGTVVSRNKLKMSKLFAADKDCYLYASADFKGILSSCSSAAQPVIDESICTLGLDERGAAFNQKVPMMVTQPTDGGLAVVNDIGQILKINTARKSCGIAFEDVEGEIKFAAMKEDVIAYTENGTGFTVINKLDGLTIYLLSELMIEELIIESPDRIFYRGKDKDNNTHTGVADLYGKYKTINKLAPLE